MKIRVGRVIYGDDERIGQWIADHTGAGQLAVGSYTALGCEDDDGKLTGGALFTNHRNTPGGGDIEVAVYLSSPRDAQPHIIRRIFAYPFNQLGCVRVTAEIHMENSRCWRLAEGIGFHLETIKRGTRVGVFGLLRDDFMRPR